MTVNYDCSRCPGYCCSYPRIVVSDADIERLATHHDLDFKTAKRRFTQVYRFESEDEQIKERILKHRPDSVYKTVCQFFDQDLRRCTVYEARPSVCREYPNGKTCGYYQFLKFERKQQGDKDFIPSA